MLKDLATYHVKYRNVPFSYKQLKNYSWSIDFLDSFPFFGPSSSSSLPSLRFSFLFWPEGEHRVRGIEHHSKDAAWNT